MIAWQIVGKMIGVHRGYYSTVRTAKYKSSAIEKWALLETDVKDKWQEKQTNLSKYKTNPRQFLLFPFFSNWWESLRKESHLFCKERTRNLHEKRPTLANRGKAYRSCSAMRNVRTIIAKVSKKIQRRAKSFCSYNRDSLKGERSKNWWSTTEVLIQRVTIGSRWKVAGHWLACYVLLDNEIARQTKGWIRTYIRGHRLRKVTFQTNFDHNLRFRK